MPDAAPITRPIPRYTVLLNVAILIGIARVLRQLRRGGAFDEAELERQLESRGLMRKASRMCASVSSLRPAKIFAMPIYPWAAAKFRSIASACSPS